MKRASSVSRAVMIAGAILGAGALTGCAGTSPALTDQERAQNVESFDVVWETVRERHWDPDLNGVDWDGARDELRPRVEAATTNNEARRQMQALLQRLDQSHFGIIPEETYERIEEEEAEGSSGEGWAGLDLRLVDDDVLVWRVRESGPAYEAGVRPGWIVRSIKGREVASLVEAMRAVDGIEPASTRVALIAGSRFGGEPGDSIDAEFIDGEDETRQVSIVLAEAPGEMASIGELPAAPVDVVARTLDGGIGYFYLSIFLDPPRVLGEFQQFIEDHRDAPGLIIDLRGNPGGIILMSTGIMNWLVQERGLRLGTMKMRDPVRGPFEFPIMINPRGTTFDGPVAVLIDEASISNSEILSAGLQDVGRARVFGARTAGLVLPSTVIRLPNGDGFQYAFASYTSSGGGALEAIGVTPDVETPLTREALLSGGDPALDAAMEWISGLDSN